MAKVSAEIDLDFFEQAGFVGGIHFDTSLVDKHIRSDCHHNNRPAVLRLFLLND